MLENSYCYLLVKAKKKIHFKRIFFCEKKVERNTSAQIILIEVLMTRFLRKKFPATRFDRLIRIIVDFRQLKKRCEHCGAAVKVNIFCPKCDKTMILKSGIVYVGLFECKIHKKSTYFDIGVLSAPWRNKTIKFFSQFLVFFKIFF